MGNHDVNDRRQLEQLQKRIGANVHAAIKSKALHGGRKVPKSTITMYDTPLSLVIAIMSPHRDKLSSESKRMIKWNLADIATFTLQSKAALGLVIPMNSTAAKKNNKHRSRVCA